MIHNVFMDVHDGNVDTHNCCELLIFMIIIKIHNPIIDIHIQYIVQLWICNCIMGNIFEDHMVLTYTYGYP